MSKIKQKSNQLILINVKQYKQASKEAPYPVANLL